MLNRIYSTIVKPNSDPEPEPGPVPIPDEPELVPGEQVEGVYEFIINNNILTIYSASVGYTETDNVVTKFDIPWLNNTNITSVRILGPITTKSGSLQTLFNGLTNCTEITGLKYVDLSNVTNISNLFNGCTNLKSVKWNDIDVFNYIGLNDNIKNND